MSGSPASNRTAPPGAVSVAGLDPSGGAGLALDLAAFRSLGLHGLPVLACVTFQDPSSFEGAEPVAPFAVERQLRHALATVPVGAVKTGMLADAGLVRAVARVLDDTDAPLVVDPVLRATLAAEGSAEAAAARAQLVEALRVDLLPRSALVTPNAEEAARLSGMQVTDLRSAEEAARRIQAQGARAVLVKGGHLPPVAGRRVDLLLADGQIHRWEAADDGLAVHGSGCALSALAAGHLARGVGVVDAVRAARAAVADARRRSLATGGKLRLLSFAEAGRGASRDAGEARLGALAERLAATLPPVLAPEVGVNVALLDGNEVLSLDGRIHRAAGRLVSTGAPRRGHAGHVGRVLLAANRAMPSVRAAVNLRFHPAVVEAATAAGLRAATFDRTTQPRDRPSSLDWGVTEALRGQRDPVDLVWDAGGAGKEAMVRLLARDGDELLVKVARLVARLDVGAVTND